MPFVVPVSKLYTETKSVAKRRLANLLVVWTAVSSSSYQNLGFGPRTSAFSTHRTGRHRRCRHRHHHNHGLCSPSTTLSAFGMDHERTTSVSLRAGREKRISSSDNHHEKQQQQQHTSEQQKLIEKEEAARQQRIGQLGQRFKKAVGRENRISFLEEKIAKEEAAAKESSHGSPDAPTTEIGANNGGSGDDAHESFRVTDAERAELEGLLRVRESFEEQYDPQQFSEEHLEFKAVHNDVFARLVRWCEDRRDTVVETEPKAEEPKAEEPEAIPTATTRVFFLDGPDGGTASSLIRMGNFGPTQCYVANRHGSTCSVLRQSGGGLLPEENVVDATSSEALTKGAYDAKQGAFAHLEFTGYYFDGCNGFVPHIVNMMSSALLVLDDDLGGTSDGNNEPALRQQTKNDPRYPIAVGYSVLGGNKDVVEKELEVSRALTIIARSRGMKIVHALDDPSRFGLPPGVSKLGGNGGNTFTTWLVLLPDDDQ